MAKNCGAEAKAKKVASIPGGAIWAASVEVRGDHRTSPSLAANNPPLVAGCVVRIVSGFCSRVHHVPKARRADSGGEHHDEWSDPHEVRAVHYDVNVADM